MNKDELLDQKILYAMARKKKLQDTKKGGSLKELTKNILNKDHSEMIIDSLRSNEPKKKKLESKEEFLERIRKELGI